MNEQVDLLQERLEQLEAGAPLAELLLDCPQEEAELLQLAAALQQINVPAPNATNVITRRTELLLLAQRQRQITGVGFWQTLQEWLQGRQWVVATSVAVIVMVLLLGISLWARSEQGANTAVAPTPPLATDPELALIVAETDIETTVTADDTPVTAVDMADDTELEASLPVSDTPAIAAALYNHFIPIMESPFMTSANQAGLINPLGLVEVQRADGAWTAVTHQVIVSAGQHVRTGSLSSVTLLFYDGSQATLGPDSEISLDSVEALRPADGFRTVILTQLAGESTHTVQFRNDSGSRYEVKTLTGSGIARGTRFRVSIGADSQTSYAVTEGRVEVRNAERTVSVTAGQVTSFTADAPPNSPTFLISGEGVVTAIETDAWTIAGQIFTIDATTVIVGSPQVGDYVHVEGHMLPNDTPYAERITLLYESPLNRFRLTGPVEEIGATAWVVAGQSIGITATTIIDPDIAIGDRVLVTGLILADSQFEAERIERLEDQNELPFSFVGVVQTIDNETWTISGLVVTLDADTEIQGGIAVGDLVKVEGVILEGDVWLAQEIKLLETEDATFSLVGILESIDPWVMAGVSFTVRPWTLIDDNLMVGELVRVNGRILADGTWVAYEITRLDDDDDALVIVFVGVVDSMDPWVVNGLPLTNDENSIIDADVTVGSLVRVTAEIRANGIWLIRELMLLNNNIEPGCVAITAVITNLSGDLITLSNGQTVVLGEDVVIDGALRVGSVVVIIACVDDDGVITIISITVIYDPGDTPAPPPPPDPEPGPIPGGENVTICHKPGTPAQQTMSVPQPALGGHLGHGDTLGPCP